VAEIHMPTLLALSSLSMGALIKNYPIESLVML